MLNEVVNIETILIRQNTVKSLMSLRYQRGSIINRGVETTSNTTQSKTIKSKLV